MSVNSDSRTSYVNPLFQFPEDIVGDEDKMIEFTLRMKEFWCKKYDKLQERRITKMKSANESIALETNESRRGTIEISENLKVVIKNEGLSHTGVEKDNSKEDGKIGILRASYSSKKFIVNINLATKIARKLSGSETFVIKPNVFAAMTCMSAFSVSAMITFLAMWHFIPSNFVYFIFGCWPGAFYFYFVLSNTEIVMVVLRQQQTWIFYLWNIVFYICMLLEYKGQENHTGFILAWTSGLGGVFTIPLLDSIADLNIRMICNKLLLPSVIVLFVLHQISMYENWAQNDPNNNLQFLGNIKMNILSLGSSALNNLIVLLVSNVFFAYMYPHSMIMIKSKVEAVIMSEEEATVLRAMEQIGAETTEANKKQDILRKIGHKMKNKISGKE